MNAKACQVHEDWVGDTSVTCDVCKIKHSFAYISVEIRRKEISHAADEENRI